MPNLKISQLPEAVPAILQNTDLVALARGNNTVRLRGDQVAFAILGSIPTDLANLTTKVNTLSARDTSTIDLSFATTTTLNTLSGNVRDGSLTPAKLSSGRPFWTTTGNVGIKTDSPANNLDVLEPGQNIAYREIARFVVSNNPTGSNFTRFLIGQVNPTRMFIEVADQLNAKGDLLINPYGGNVGVNLTDATAPLHVAGNQIIDANTTAAALRITQTGTGAALLIEDSASTDTTPFIIDANGNVGIGTTTSNAKLTIQGSSSNDITPELRISGSSGWVDFHNATNTGSYNPLVVENDKTIIFSDGTVNTGNLFIGPWQSNSFGLKIIGSTGRVGINTSNPVSTLDVAGQATVNYLWVRPQDGNLQGGEIILQGAGTRPNIAIDNYDGHIRFFSLGTGKQLQVLGGAIYADSTTAANYFASNIGVNTVGPSARIHVRETVAGINPRIFLSTSQDTQIMYSTDREGVAGWSFGQDATDFNKFKISNRFNNLQDTTRLTIDNTGKVGIGTSTPGFELDVVGTVNARNMRVVNTAGGDASIEIGGSGNVYIDLKQPNTDDFDVRLGTTDGVTSFIAAQRDFEIRPNQSTAGGRFIVRGDIVQTGSDIFINHTPRGAGGRAIVHDASNTLVLNYAGDFTGGTRVDSNLTLPTAGRRLGIGTSNPGVSIDVIQSTGLAELRLWGTRTGTWAPNVLYFSDNDGVVNRYFMGTRGTNDTALHNNIQDGQVGSWKFFYHNNEGNVLRYPVVMGVYPNALNSNGYRLGLHNDTIYVDQNERVGIGTQDPVYKLDVAGDIRSSSNLILRRDAPTIYFQDTDNRSAMLHMNGDTMHLLRGTGNDSINWAVLPNGWWPATVNVSNGDTILGGNLFLQGVNTNQYNSNPGHPPYTLISLRGPAGGNRFVQYLTANENRSQAFSRFDAGIDNFAESGSNTGSNYFINRFADNGAYLGTPFAINRASGLVSIQNNLHVSTSNATGGGIILADDGDIVDLNDGWCSMRFSLGVRVYSANRSGEPVISFSQDGRVTSRNSALVQPNGWAFASMQGQVSDRVVFHVGGDTSNEFRIGRYTRDSVDGNGWVGNPFRLNMASGEVRTTGDLVIGEGKQWSYLWFGDSNEDWRVIHNNSNRIGFLNQAYGWGSWCDDNGDWVVEGSAGTLRIGSNSWIGNTTASINLDNNVYKSLMIVGNNVGGNAGKGRQVDIFDHLFVHGPITARGNVASNDVFNGGVELREVNGVANTQSGTEYAPALSFHWALRAAGKLRMGFDGHFALQAQGSDPNAYRNLSVARLHATNGFHVADRDNITTRLNSGFYQTSTATRAEGWPTDQNHWYHLMASTHSNESNYYSMQFAGSFYHSSDLFYRATDGNGNAPWHRVWNNSNSPASLAANGWTILANGLIIQWGYAGPTNRNFNFPIAFPNACFSITIGNADSQGSWIDNSFAYHISRTQFYAASKFATPSVAGISSYGGYWVAFGH